MIIVAFVGNDGCDLASAGRWNLIHIGTGPNGWGVVQSDPGQMELLRRIDITLAVQVGRDQAILTEEKARELRRLIRETITQSRKPFKK